LEAEKLENNNEEIWRPPKNIKCKRKFQIWKHFFPPKKFPKKKEL
jgi:hypothetical protein